MEKNKNADGQDHHLNRSNETSELNNNQTEHHHRRKHDGARHQHGEDERSHRHGRGGRGHYRDDHHRDGHGAHHHGGRHADHGRQHGRGDDHDHHRHDHHRGQRPKRQRLFDYGELRLLVLVMIETQPRHGYELIKEIEERFEGRYTPSPGVIYPTLTWLDDMGYALQVVEGSKKQYRITDEGVAFLTANRDAANELLTRRPALSIEDERRNGADRHNLRELMGSLRHLIKDKLFQAQNQTQDNEQLCKDISAIVQKAYDDIKKLG